MKLRSECAHLADRRPADTWDTSDSAARDQSWWIALHFQPNHCSHVYFHYVHTRVYYKTKRPPPPLLPRARWCPPKPLAAPKASRGRWPGTLAWGPPTGGDDSGDTIGHAQIQHVPAISCQRPTCRGAPLCSAKTPLRWGCGLVSIFTGGPTRKAHASRFGLNDRQMFLFKRCVGGKKERLLPSLWLDIFVPASLLSKGFLAAVISFNPDKNKNHTRTIF